MPSETMCGALLPEFYVDEPRFDNLVAGLVVQFMIESDLQPLMEDVIKLLNDQWQRKVLDLTEKQYNKVLREWCTGVVQPALQEAIDGIDYPTFQESESPSRKSIGC